MRQSQAKKKSIRETHKGQAFQMLVFLNTVGHLLRKNGGRPLYNG